MISEQIRKKHKIGTNLFMKKIKEIKGRDIYLLAGLIIFCSIILYVQISLSYIGLIISGYLIYYSFVLYQNFYSVNEKCGILTDKFVASIRKTKDIREIKAMIVRYYSDCKYSYYSENPYAYCEILKDTMFAFSRNDNDNILNADVDTGYMLEKGAILKIPAETMFQTTLDFTQIMIKSKNSLKCFSAIGSYYKINGKKKSICDTSIKIKAGTKVTFLEGECEGFYDFEMFQEDNIYPQYVLRKNTEGILI